MQYPKKIRVQIRFIAVALGVLSIYIGAVHDIQLLGILGIVWIVTGVISKKITEMPKNKALIKQ